MLLMNMGSCFQAASLFQAALVFSGCPCLFRLPIYVYKASKLVSATAASTAAAGTTLFHVNHHTARNLTLIHFFKDVCRFV